MTLSFGGGAGVLTIPGLTSDGATPGGIIVAGEVQAASEVLTGSLQAASAVVAGNFTAGDQNAATVPSFAEIWGNVAIDEVPGNILDGDSPLIVSQQAPLPFNSFISAVIISRQGALNGHQYVNAPLLITDGTATTAPLQQWVKQTNVVAVMGGAGGLGLFGHAAPAAPRTLAQATITAITDANAKAAVQACANALADMGVLTLT